MSTIRKVPVRLTQAEAEALIGICQNYARSRWETARRLKHESTAEHVRTQAVKSGDLASELTRRLFMTTEDAALDRGLANGIIEPPDAADQAEDDYNRRHR